MASETPPQGVGKQREAEQSYAYIRKKSSHCRGSSQTNHPIMLATTVSIRREIRSMIERGSNLENQIPHALQDTTPKDCIG